MPKRFSIRLTSATAAVAALALLPLVAGCNRNPSAQQAMAAPALPATLPLAPGALTRPAYAPAVAALPQARLLEAVRVADPGEDYAYADDAWGFADAWNDAPPDYGFDYDNVEPWAWQGYDDSLAFAEPIEGGYRYYYYRPGADAPYFIRDADYGYGYDDGRLAIVYGPDGEIVPYSDYGPRLDYASRYFVRGQDLYRASRSRHPVIAANWLARQNEIAASQARWTEERQRQQQWQAYHQRVAPRERSHWQEERTRRRADVVQLAAWQRTGFTAPPPPRAIPAAWTKASWARDDRRYLPIAAAAAATGAVGAAARRDREASIHVQGRNTGPHRADQRILPPQPAVERRPDARAQSFANRPPAPLAPRVPQPPQHPARVLADQRREAARPEGPAAARRAIAAAPARAASASARREQVQQQRQQRMEQRQQPQHPAPANQPRAAVQAARPQAAARVERQASRQQARAEAQQSRASRIEARPQRAAPAPVIGAVPAPPRVERPARPAPAQRPQRGPGRRGH